MKTIIYGDIQSLYAKTTCEKNEKQESILHMPFYQFHKDTLCSNNTYKTFECNSDLVPEPNVLFSLMKQEGIGEYMFKIKAKTIHGVYNDKEMKLKMQGCKIVIDGGVYAVKDDWLIVKF